MDDESQDFNEVINKPYSTTSNTSNTRYSRDEPIDKILKQFSEDVNKKKSEESNEWVDITKTISEPGYKLDDEEKENNNDIRKIKSYNGVKVKRSSTIVNNPFGDNLKLLHTPSVKRKMLSKRAYFSKKMTNNDISACLKYLKSVAEKTHENNKRSSIQVFNDNIKNSIITKLQTLSIICTLLSNWATSLYNESSTIDSDIKDISKTLVWMSLMYFFVCTVTSLILIIEIQNTPDILLSDKIQQNKYISYIPNIFMTLAIVHLKISYLLDFMAKYNDIYIYSCSIIFSMCGGIIIFMFIFIYKSKFILFNRLMKIHDFPQSE